MYPLIPALLGGMIYSTEPAPDPSPPPTGIFRSIPEEAVRGEMQPPWQGSTNIAGKNLQLAPGAQIRDEHNRIILSDNVRQPVLVKYLTDTSGQLIRVWVLTAEEAARP